MTRPGRRAGRTARGGGGGRRPTEPDAGPKRPSGRRRGPTARRTRTTTRTRHRRPSPPSGRTAWLGALAARGQAAPAARAGLRKADRREAQVSVALGEGGKRKGEQEGAGGVDDGQAAASSGRPGPQGKGRATAAVGTSGPAGHDTPHWQLHRPTCPAACLRPSCRLRWAVRAWVACALTQQGG